MINRVWTDGDIVFTGGVAKNPCMINLLEGKLEQKLLVPDDPQLVGALGAALLAKEQI
jgi:activator of 2-hydroxyglutaryl-CoA dehydratase